MNTFFCSMYRRVKAWTEVHFLYEARSTLLHANKTTKKCIQFLNNKTIEAFLNRLMHVFIDPLSIYFYRVDKRLLFYYCLLLRELFLYSVVWWGIVPEPTARALYITRQHYGKTVLNGEDNNIFSTQHPIPDIKEKHTQIQYNNNNKIYNVTLYLHCQTWPCWQQTTARVYFKGDKYDKSIYKLRWKIYATGIVPAGNCLKLV